MSPVPEHSTCVVVGGGPAGMVAALILARSGVEVTVLEKHGDFLRDFRGDTVHPTTLDLLDELGLYERFDALPHSVVRELVIRTATGEDVRFADIGALKLPHPFVAIAPQWDFLDLLADAGSREPGFRLLMNAEFIDLLREGDRVVGVTYATAAGEQELRADLVIGADGRWSRVREKMGRAVREFPVGIDLWWFRVPADGPVGESILPRSADGRLFVVVPRTGYAQMAMIIPKGADAVLRAEGIEGLRTAVGHAVPALAATASQLEWDDVKLLDVRVNRLDRWYVEGLLCIGDAAHAMSPVGGVGVNLAVQDGVAAAARLAGPLSAGTLTTRDLAAVQRRRDRPARFTQSIQRAMHRVLLPIVRSGEGITLPRPMIRLFRTFPALARIPARAIVVGLRPEHAPPAARRPSEPGDPR